MVEIKNLCVSLRADGRRIVDKFDFTLADGDKAVIIGEEGNGKSTLLKCIYDRASVESYCDVSGEIKTGGRMAYLAQSADAALDRVRLCDFFDVDWYSHIDEVERLFSFELLTSERRLGELSGGEKVRARLLRLLLDEPDVLLLDEPTNDLDISTLEWLEKFLRVTRLPVLFVSHDETLIENVADVIVHMEQVVRKTECRITVARCGYREYVEKRAALFERQRQIAQKQRDDYAKQEDRWRHIHDRVEHELRSISRRDPAGGRLLKKKMQSVVSTKKRFEREREDFTEFPKEEEAIITEFEPVYVPRGKAVLDVYLPSLEINGRTLARDIKLFVRGGEKVGIVGANGAGKSTFLGVLWEMLRVRTDITAAYMPQDYSDALDYGKTPVEYLTADYSKESVTKARTYMGSMRFTHAEMTSPIGKLSGGQRAKILFLDMVLRGANVLLLDEPTRNFSPLSAPVVRGSISRFGGSVISVSHDRKYLGEVCDTVYEFTPSGLIRVDV